MGCGDVPIHEYMRDIGANACMPDNVVLYATNYYEKIKTSLTPKFKQKTIAAYALYEALNTFDIPRMADEIAYYTGVKQQDIWRVESNLVLEDTLNDPVKYVHHYCTLLKFSWADQVCVQRYVELLQELPLGNLRCNCLVAVVIYLYCKDTKKKIILKKICETCNISATSVHRVIRQLHELKSQISKFPLLEWLIEHV